MARPGTAAVLGVPLIRGWALKVIRILLGAMPRLLRDVVREVLGRQPDMDIVGEVESDDDLLRSLRLELPDVVVLQLSGLGLSQTGARVLERQPGVHVLGLSGDGRSAAIYRARIPHAPAFEGSPQGLRLAIREACERGPR